MKCRRNFKEFHDLLLVGTSGRARRVVVLAGTGGGASLLPLLWHPEEALLPVGAVSRPQPHVKGIPAPPRLPACGPSLLTSLLLRVEG